MRVSGRTAARPTMGIGQKFAAQVIGCQAPKIDGQLAHVSHF
jgi:hypothetical protein